MPNNGHFALVVGIDDYPYYRSLKGAINDANEFYKWLLNKDNGGDVPKENVGLILSKNDPVSPIHDQIDYEVLKLIHKAQQAGEKTRFYFYFSGHGLSRDIEGVDLCLAGWSTRMRGRALDSNSYLKLLRECGHFREVFSFFDCCRLRQVRKTALPTTIEPPAPGDGASSSRFFKAFATEFMNAAYEAEIGQTQEVSSFRGHFTQALIEALSGKAAEPDGGVRPSKLKAYLEKRTREIAQEHKHRQQALAQYDLPDDDDIRIGLAKGSVPQGQIAVNIVFKKYTNGEAVVEDGNLTVLRRGDVSTSPWLIQLSKPNMLEITYLTTGEKINIRVDGNKTEKFNVEF